MKLLVVSKLAPANRYIVDRVLTEWPDASVIRPYWGTGQRRVSGRTKLRTAPVRTVGNALRRAWYAPYDRHAERVVSRALFGSPRPPTAPEHQAVPAAVLNTSAGVDLVRSLEPDLMVLSGAPVLGDPVLSVPSLGVVNVHFGISPHYRGSHTLFQALYREDYANVGVTLHFVDRGVDTGNIVAQGFPELGPGDTEATVQAKCAKLAAELLTEFLHAYPSTTAAGVPQTERGTLYRFRDRTPRQDLRYLWRRTILGRRPRHQHSRVVKFF